MIQSEKNKLIGDQRRLTSVKRKSQVCKSFKFKVLRSSLTSSQKEYLKMYFVEAKWIYNYLLSQQNVFKTTSFLSVIIPPFKKSLTTYIIL